MWPFPKKRKSKVFGKDYTIADLVQRIETANSNLTHWKQYLLNITNNEVNFLINREDLGQMSAGLSYCGEQIPAEMKTLAKFLYNRLDQVLGGITPEYLSQNKPECINLLTQCIEIEQQYIILLENRLKELQSLLQGK